MSVIDDTRHFIHKNNQLRLGLIELWIGLIELVIGLIELGIGVMELGIGLIELRVGLMELGIHDFLFIRTLFIRTSASDFAKK